MPTIAHLLGAPAFDNPWAPVYGVLDDGVLTAPTPTRFAVIDADGHTVAFAGSFTVIGGEITGGTVTGFTARAGSTAMTIGSGYAIPATALVEALRESIDGDDDGPFWDLIRGSPSPRAARAAAAGGGTPASPSLPAPAMA